MTLEEHARRLLLSRVGRMQRLIASDAPDCLLSMEAELIGDAGRMLDPAGYLQRQVERELANARRRFGLCSMPACDASVVPGGDECEVHSDEQVGVDALANGPVS